MTTDKRLLLIPVENQVRELDPKLLLACIAAQRGFSSVIGSRREMEFRIDSYRKSIYLSKSMTKRSLLFFRLARKFDHEIVTWDEEALVHLPPDTYFSRRLHPDAIRQVSHLFAWGEDNVELWRQYPHLPESLPIHGVGNPRIDMLRPELRTFYAEEVQSLRDTYGDFLLINTNFNHVNAFGEDMNLFQPVKTPGEPPRFGRAAKGMSREYAECLWKQKQAVFSDFQELIPRLDKAFPGLNIVIRPHPTEKHDIYHEIASRCARVHVTNQGNVVPWILATRAVLHNGCTTGIEAFLLDVPGISYRASIDETIDNGFYRLPHEVSHQCFTFEQLQDLLTQILDGKDLQAGDDQRRALVDHHLSSLSGPLACSRIVDVLEGMPNDSEKSSRASSLELFQRRLIAGGFHLYKRVKPWLPGSHNRPTFQRHRYPPIPADMIRTKIERIQMILKDDTRLEIKQLSDVLFQISAQGLNG